MANGLNLVVLVGNIGRDPELKYTQGGAAMLRLSVATSEGQKQKDGSYKDVTEWHTVVVWGNQAEGLNKILSKGRSVWVQGKLQTRSWDDKEGFKRYATEINAFRVSPVGAAHGGGGRTTDRRHSANEGGMNPGYGRDDTPDFAGGDDDIPF